jgi:NADPH-dependent 2,4-dienoyl-CoA reductase/sulfur reductase-like enzyme
VVPPSTREFDGPDDPCATAEILMSRPHQYNWDRVLYGAMPAKADTLTMARRLAIVGAGPVGCLAAISFAKMGWSVEIYESRPGIRLFHLPGCPVSQNQP